MKAPIGATEQELDQAISELDALKPTQLLELFGGIIDMSISQVPWRGLGRIASTTMWCCHYCHANSTRREPFPHHDHCLIARLQIHLNQLTK